jgi:hypothetical protein
MLPGRSARMFFVLGLQTQTQTQTQTDASCGVLRLRELLRSGSHHLRRASKQLDGGWTPRHCSAPVQLCTLVSGTVCSLWNSYRHSVFAVVVDGIRSRSCRIRTVRRLRLHCVWHCCVLRGRHSPLCCHCFLRAETHARSPTQGPHSAHQRVNFKSRNPTSRVPGAEPTYGLGVVQVDLYKPKPKPKVD